MREKVVNLERSRGQHSAVRVFGQDHDLFRTDKLPAVVLLDNQLAFADLSTEYSLFLDLIVDESLHRFFKVAKTLEAYFQKEQVLGLTDLRKIS